MTILGEQLNLSRCPHCSADKPSLLKVFENTSANYQGGNPRCWRIYCCRGCGGYILASAINYNQEIIEVYPKSEEVDETIPDVAREYLKQAVSSLNAPAGAIMLCASSIDAMLKNKEYIEGSLYSRIDQAKNDNLITENMAEWAHEVRLDANDERHADKNHSLPVEDDAKRVIEFTISLAEFLFVLPSKVRRGIEDARNIEENSNTE